MFDFFNRLFGRQSSTGGTAIDPDLTGVRLYWREHGPVAYEARVFNNPAAGGLRADLPQQLMTSGLAWFWESGRYSDEYAPVNPSLPKRRSLTALSEATSADLLADIQEHIGGCPRWFTLFAAEPADQDQVLRPGARQRMLEAFSVREAGPLRLVINQEGPLDWESVFVPHNLSPAATALLASWGVTRENAVRTFEDREQNGIFEATFGLPQRPAS